VSTLQRALVSVSDKSGIAEFARALAALGVQILSTGGTAKLLEKEGIPVTEVSAHTGFPEMLDGRVKTLHPKIHGGILARRDRPEHLAAIEAAGIAPIDLVVVNLYPFQAAVADPDSRLEDAIENIDIGGPAMLRSAAKNHAAVAVVVDPADYGKVLEELRAAGEVSAATRFALATKAFAHTAAYDGAIASYLSSLGAGGARHAWPGILSLQFTKLQDMRYGENPHQSAAFYRDHFGATEVSRDENVHGQTRIFLFLGKQLLVLSPFPPDIAPADPPSAGDGAYAHGFGVAHFGLRVDDVESAVEELAAGGVTILGGPTHEASGLNYAYIAAPDGVVIELTQYG